VQVEYDPSKVSYKQILDAFWRAHDPTVVNSYHGGQYRSAIFFHTPEQASLAMAARAELERKLGRAVQTEISPASTFYRAEEYHQHYYEKHRVGACHL